ncbi:S8 family serine peptidase [Hymenobacter caeli]|uniref:Subtilisin family serine protease n=1 Tax=Hymenobacter caeli TaxID=2735894 RepID=A0ABX2FUQ0_9BACT|nr:S8 family serine peptidase [Hymenobacter caeli]NRT20910.1 subtilisin family serine protease [Hymenobacter caeli]
MRRLFFVAFLGTLATGFAARAQPAAAAAPPARYWVSLADKDGVAFDPNAYFSAPARARRARQHLPAAEATDRPVRPDYLARVRAAVDTVTLVSRWFNAVAVRATPAQAAALRALPGVREVAAWPQRGGGVAAARLRPGRTAATRFAGDEPPYISPDDYRLAHRQTAALGAAAWARAGLAGRGLRIALFDVGFRGVESHPAFAALRARHGIVATHDFLANGPNVYRGGSHGTEVLGCLAGRLPGGPDAAVAAGPALGLAPAAEYLLARTERALRETLSEEEAWLAAAEWADREGADIINSSLAYTEQRYFPEEMDGRRSLVARAAALAAHKGMLVVCAAGNDGDTDWVRIGTPADADSVLAVGGLDPVTGLHLAFSSVGPSADHRVKPDVSAFGIALTTTPGGGYERLEGTSFAAPLVAGFAACAWQHNRRLTAAQLYGQLRAAGQLYPYFDYAHGYGAPRAAYFLDGPPARPAGPTFDFVAGDSLVAVIIRPAAAVRPAEALPLVAELPEASGGPGPGGPPLAPDPDFPAYIYWHLADRRGVLRRYEVRAVAQRLVLQVPRRLLRGGDALQVEFKGYTATYTEPAAPAK